MDLPLYRDKGDDAYTVSVHIPESSPRFRQSGKDDAPFRVRVLAEDIAGEPYWVQTAKPMEKLEEEISDLVAAICIGLAVSTALLLVRELCSRGPDRKTDCRHQPAGPRDQRNDPGKKNPDGRKPG